MTYGLNIWSRTKQYHKFVTDDLPLLEIGMGVYNLDSATQFFKYGGADNNPDVKALFNTPLSSMFIKLTGKEDVGSLKLEIFNEDDRDYEEIIGLSDITTLDTTQYKSEDFEKKLPGISNSAASLELFLNTWDNIQKGYIILPKKEQNSYKAIVNRIINSKTGCINFEIDYVALGESRTAKIKLYLLFEKESKTGRVITLNGAPIISEVPTTAYDTPYGYNATSNLPPGVLASPVNNDIGDRVAGTLQVAYDPSTGKFHSGTTQILARLLDNLDSADQPSLTTSELENLSRDDVYIGNDSNGYMSNFSKGRALPLSTVNGNPHLFGPDFKDGCENPTAKNIITVINRLGMTYKAGDIVVCSKMLGEGGNWVITSNGRPSEKAPSKPMGFGSFEFARCLIALSSYFTYAPNVNIVEKCLPDTYLQAIRATYNTKFIDIVATNNVSSGGSIVDLGKIVNLNSLGFDDETRKLNCLLLSMPSETSNPIQYLYEKSNTIPQELKNNNDIANKYSNLFVGVSTNPFINALETAGVLYLPQVPNTGISDGFLPKNHSKGTINTTKGIYYFGPDSVGDSTDSTLPVLSRQAPFWGALFPDGYTAESVSSEVNRLNVQNITLYNVLTLSPIFSDDPNKSELDISAGLSLVKLDKFIDSLYNYQNTSRSWNSPGDKPLVTESSFQKNAITILAPNGFSIGNSPQSNKLFTSDPTYIQNLRPTNLSKIQFSSLSIGPLYSQSQLSTTPTISIAWNQIKSIVSRYTSIGSKVEYGIDILPTILYGNYIKSIVWGIPNIISPTITATEVYYDTTASSQFVSTITNIYNTSLLSFKKSLLGDWNRGTDSKIINRHPSPLGTFYNAIPGVTLTNNTLPDGTTGLSYFSPGGEIIIKPPLSSTYSVIPAVPVITCKFRITTPAQGLKFSVDQLFGMSRKTTVVPGKAPDVISIPTMGGGLVWTSNPATPPKESFTVQWGDRGRSDDIDSLGTTALHVMGYQSWPENKTVFIPHMFTVLHYNDGSYRDIDMYEHEVKGDDQSGYTISKTQVTIDGKVGYIFKPSSVDFKEPTKEDGTLYNKGETPIASTDQSVAAPQRLAPLSKWKWNISRRNKLLSRGGFAYYRKIIRTIPSSNPPTPQNAGSNYQVGQKFRYTDGTQIEVTSINATGGITGIRILDIKPTNTVITLNPKLQPSPMSATGSGAKFNDVTFIVDEIIGYDPAPKMVIPISRLTKSSDGGEKGESTGNSETVVNFSDTSSKAYDIFYFYHNDPTHYSEDEGPYNLGFAQYATVEVAATS